MYTHVSFDCAEDVWFFLRHVYRLEDVPRVGNLLQSLADRHSDLLADLARGARNEASPAEIHRMLQGYAGLKKWRFTTASQGALARAAIEGFLERNRTVPDMPVDKWVCEEMRKLLRRWLPRVDGYQVPRMGPGAVAEHLDFVGKRKAYPAALAQLDGHPLTTFSEFGVDALPSDDRQVWDDAATARLCAVPKDWNKLRLITVEPFTNSLAQQQARSYLEASLRRGALSREGEYSSVWRNFFTSMPDCQRRRALAASHVGSSVATVDLSDASDGISWGFVRRVFPSHVVAWLEVSRTRYFSVPGSIVPHYLRIYAGMGNATTFLVETLLFTAYVVALSHERGIATEVTTFGDDIICDARLLESAPGYRSLETGTPFFRINWKKTFGGVSAFRESCGLFAFHGVDVSYSYLKGYDVGTPRGISALCELQRTLRRRGLYFHSDRVAADWIQFQCTIFLESPIYSVPLGCCAGSVSLASPPEVSTSDLEQSVAFHTPDDDVVYTTVHVPKHRIANWVTIWRVPHFQPVSRQVRMSGERYPLLCWFAGAVTSEEISVSPGVSGFSDSFRVTDSRRRGKLKLAWQP